MTDDNPHISPMDAMIAILDAIHGAPPAGVADVQICSWQICAVGGRLRPKA